MSRTFSLATLIRQTPRSVLQPVLRKLRVPVDLAAGPTAAAIAAVAAALDGLDDRRRNRAESTLRDIHALATAAGTTALAEADALLTRGAVAASLGDAANAYHWAAATWLDRRPVFDLARAYDLIDRMPPWRRRDGLPRVAPDIGPARRREMSRRVSAVLTAAQGRGRQCTVEALERRGVHYAYVHADDHVQTLQVHAKGRLAARTVRPTFDLVFAFDPRAGTLDTSARVSPTVKDRLDTSFAEVFLGAALGPYRRVPAFRLGGLLAPGFRFVVPPASGLTAILRKVRFAVPGTKREIELQSDPDRDDLFDVMFEYLDHNKIDVADVRVLAASVECRFDDPEYGAAKRTVRLTAQSSDLPNLPDWQADLVRDCLRRSGILAGGDPA